MRPRLLASLLLGVTLAGSVHAAAPVFTGVDANYSLGMEREGKTWRWDGKADDLFSGIARAGVQGFRVRLWTGDEGQNGRDYATEVVKRARAAALEPYLVIFLSEDWADLMKQPLPKIWQGLTFDERLAAVQAYSRDVVTHFRKNGLRSHLYEIGNEIDYGIAGVYPSKGAKKSPAALSRSCWPQAAKLILASQAGVRAADPDAKFLLHIAHWWDPEFCVAFFEFMRAQGVQLDYAGLSYFPSSNIGGSLEMEQFGAVVTRVAQAAKCPVIVPETAYPSTADFKGQFSRWKKAVPGYPLSPDGQRRWLADFLAFCAHHPDIASVYYWSPEWYGEGMWKAFAFFDPAGEAKPAWASFAGPRADRPPPRRNVHFEQRGDRLYPVPIAAARAVAAPALRKRLAEFGRVNVDYIKAITDQRLVVGGYRVNLRASLSGNLDLTLADDAPVPPPAAKSLDPLDPKTTRVVVFTADPASPALAATLALARDRGFEAVPHPQPADAPLKFGFGQDWQHPPATE